MRRLIGVSLLVAACIALSSTDVQAQKKKGGQAPAGPALDSDKLAVTEIVGILRSVPGSDRKFTIEVPAAQTGAAGYGGKGGNAAALQRAQTQLLTARTLQQRQQAMRRLVQLAQGGGGGKNRGGNKGGNGNVAKKEIEFQATENVKVRTLLLPNQFDEKGNIKKLTSAELATLKGKDKNLPGYEASLEQLESGQPVRLVLAAAPAKKPEDKDKDKEDPAAADKKRQVKLIVVLGEAAKAAAPAKGKKK